MRKVTPKFWWHQKALSITWWLVRETPPNRIKHGRIWQSFGPTTPISLKKTVPAESYGGEGNAADFGRKLIRLIRLSVSMLHRLKKVATEYPLTFAPNLSDYASTMSGIVNLGLAEGWLPHCTWTDCKLRDVAALTKWLFYRFKLYTRLRHSLTQVLYTSWYIRTHTQTYIHTYIIHTYIHTYTHIYIRMCIYIYICCNHL